MLANKKDYKTKFGRTSPPRAPVFAPEITGPI